MRPADIEHLLAVSAPRVHPSGEFAVVAVSHPSLAADAEVGQLWSIPLPDGEPFRLTRGFRDTRPRFSPDGRLLGFLRKPDAASPAQLHVAPAVGGEPVRVSDAKLGVSDFAFSPDGRRVAFVARAPEEGRYGTDPEVKADAEPPRRITTLSFHANGVGWTKDRPAQVFVADVPDPRGEPAEGAPPAARWVRDDPTGRTRSGRPTALFGRRRPPTRPATRTC